MNPSVKLLLIFILYGTLVSFFLIFTSSKLSIDIYREKVENNLKTIIDAHSQHINTYIVENILKVEDFSNDEIIKDFVIESNKEVLDEGSKIMINEYIMEHKFLKKDFYDIFVLDNKGMVIGSSNPDILNKTDYSQDLIYIEGSKTSYLGDFTYDKEFSRNGLMIAAPIFEKDEFSGNFVGVIVFRMSIDPLVELIRNIGNFDEENPVGIGSRGDIYIINNIGYMITPSRFLKGETKGVLLQKVDTTNFQNCIKLDITKGRINHEEVTYGLDFRGENIVGVHKEIPQTPWCLLVEVGEDEMIRDPIISYIKKLLLLFIPLIIVLAASGFFIGKYFEKGMGKK